jgi:L-alanine-DL-glutamate epimerase-like enolase superfamily enzyme
VRIVEIRERTVPIRSAISNSVIDFSQMTASVVAVISDQKRAGRRLVGYGFNSNGRYAQGGLLRERFIPRLLAAEPGALLNDSESNFDPDRIWSILMRNEKPGGHGERSVAVGVLDMAVWDLVAKVADEPLHALLSREYGRGRSTLRVWVYAAGGYYYPDKDVAALQAEMRSYLERGYTTVKLKIGGATLDDDLRRIEAVIDVVGDAGHIAVDANGRFDLETAVRYAEALEPYGLRWYEEAGDPLDYALQAELADRYNGPMATGENLFSIQDARNLIRYGGMRPDRDVLQMDPSLSYGLVEYLRILEMLEAAGWSLASVVPHGGHQMALNIAAGLGLGGNESYPDVFQPFGGFADDIPVTDGYVEMPDSPGVGFERKGALFAILKDLVADVGAAGT